MWLNKFNELRKISGLSLDELSQKSGIPKGTLSKISAGITKTPSLETMRSLVHAMGYTLDDLEDSHTQQQINGHLYEIEYDIIKKYRALDEHGKDMVDTVLIKETARMEKEKNSPALNAEDNKVIQLQEPIQAASAGYGEFADDETADIVTVKYNSLTSKADYIMRVAGNSMEPKFYDGQRVLVRQQPAVELGEIGIFIKENERYIKIYRGDHMESANPDYKDEPFEEYSRCVGKVLGVLEEEWIVE